MQLNPTKTNTSMSKNACKPHKSHQNKHISPSFTKKCTPFRLLWSNKRRYVGPGFTLRVGGSPPCSYNFLIGCQPIRELKKSVLGCFGARWLVCPDRSRQKNVESENFLKIFLKQKKSGWCSNPTDRQGFAGCHDNSVHYKLNSKSP